MGKNYDSFNGNVVMVLSFLLITISLIALVGCTPEVLPEETIEVGLLVPRSGIISSIGESSQAGVELAVEEVNKHLQETEAGFNISLNTEDAGDTPETALATFNKLMEKDIKIVIAPAVSEQMMELIPAAAENDVLLITPTSTAISLSAADNNMFRLVSSDDKQADAILFRLGYDNKKALVILHMDDSYGFELADSLKGKLDKSTDNISLFDTVSYSQQEVNFRPTVNKLKTVVEKAVAQHEKDNVAILMISFEETTDIFRIVADDKFLSSLSWYGTDSIAQTGSLLKDEKAAAFAAAVGLTCTNYQAKGSGTEEVRDKLTQKLGRAPEDYALISYDALWLTALSYQEAGTNANTSALRKTIPIVAQRYQGVSGSTSLNRAGDRQYGTYAFWQVQKNEDGKYEWVNIFWYSS